MYEAGVEQNTNKNEFANAKIAYVGLMYHLFVKVRLANFSKQTKPNIKLQIQKKPDTWSGFLFEVHQQRVTELPTTTHHFEELCVVLGRLHFVEDEFHRFDLVHAV